MNELLCIWGLWIVEDLIGQALFDDLAVEHDDGAVCEHADDR